MAECTYDFTGPDGKPVRIQGRAEFKAYLANGGLEHFGIRSPGGDTKFSQSSQAMPDTIKVNGVDRPTTNSNGKPIHPTEEGVRKFWEWFGSSTAVDDDGRPLVMYHGTSANEGGDAFTSFNAYGSNYGLMGLGGYFTADPQVASSYTTKGRGDSPSVYPVFLSIKNPIDMESKAKPSAWRNAFDGIDEYHDGGATNESWYRAAEDMIRDQGLPMWEGAEAMQDGLRAMGFDGVTHIGGGRVKNSEVRHRVFISFDPEQSKSATGNDGTFDPANPDIRFSFAGQSSQTADKHALSSAQSRLDAGESAEKVRQDTGWFKGNDGKWRYEISDADAKLKKPYPSKGQRWGDTWKSMVGRGQYSTVGMMIDHPALFAAYPQIADIPVSTQPGSGASYSVQSRQITLGEDVQMHEALNILLHEMQHGIQHVEGFATGGSPTDAKVKEEGRQMVRRDLAEGRISEDTNPADLLPMAYHNAYRRLAGEVEARNTQARASMSDEERRATPPSKTADVADSDVIVMFNGKVMASAPTPANAQMSRGRNTEQLHAEDFDAGLRIAQRAFPGVKIIGHASDRAPTVPLSLRQSIKKADAIGDVKGAYHEGAVHIFNNATPDLGTLEFTVAHEATHFGLAGMFGADIDPVMLNINRSNPEIQALAKELQDKYGYSIARSTEEALADMGGDMVKVRGWDKLVSFIRDFLRKHGFVREWTDTDIAALVMRARDYAKNPRATSFYRDNVFSREGEQSADLPKYSRVQLLSKTLRELVQSTAFKEWFGGSKMKAQDGTPLLFMHGSPTSFEAFDAGKLGASSAHTSSGLGHFFTRDAATASKYADGGIVYRGWLKIERPYVMPLKEAQSFKDTKASVARRGELQKQGYDGAVILDDQGKPWATVAFEPWQFKSTENNGNFDEFDDRFRFSRANQGQAGAWPIEPIGKGDRFIYNMQDKQIDTKRVVEAAKKSGVKVTDDINPYLQEELYHGRSAKKFDDFRNKELRPLLDSIRSAGLSLADVESYLWASHAKERNAQIAKINDKMPDGGSGLTNKQADDLLAGRNVTVNGNEIKGVSQSALPALQGIAKQVQAINAATRQMLVDSGMETADTIKAWEGAYSNYVPLHREDIEQGGMGTGMGFSVRGSASKRAVGSGRTVVDILGNIANQRERQIARVEKNRVGQAVLGLAKSAPNEDFWKVDDVPMMKTVEATPVFTAYDNAGKVLGTYSTQLQADRAHPSAGVTIRRTVEDKVKSRMDPTFRSKDEVFHVRVDGKDHFVTFNPQDERSMRMATALKNLDADQLGAVLQVTSKATRFFASMATQYNPIWGVVNLTRDVQGALLNLSTTSLRGKEKEVLGHTISALKGIYADLRAHRAGKNPSSKWASLFEEMQDEGGQTGYKDMFGNAKDRTEALERELDPTKWMKSPLGRVFTADGRLKVPMEIAQKRAEGFFGWLSDFNQTTENAIRLASYKTAVDNGMSKQQAASIAKNVSINFNRKGQVATQAGALYAFFNASMQGSARLAETLRGPLGKKIIKGGLALGVMQAMMLAAAGMGDDEPPEFVRERSFIIPIGDGKYISIPLPLGFHVLPNLSRIPTEYAMSGFKNGGKRIADLFGLVADTFNPIGNAGLSLQTIAPTVIDPLAALAENKDYTGKRIAKEDMSSLHPTPGYLRAKDTASELSKFMAQLFNAASGGTEFKQGMFSPTPDQLDYLIGQIAGGVGREALKIDQTLSSAVTGEELPMHKVPLLGRFVGDTKGQSAESGKFYAALTRINEHQAELKGLRASGRGAEAAEYARENPEAVLAPMATATERALSEDRKLKRKAVEAGNSELVKQIEARSSARMKAFNNRLSALEN